MSVDDILTALVSACRDKLDAEAKVADAIRRREDAQVDLCASLSIPMASQRSIERLREEGFTEEQIAGLGVSPGATRLALSRRRRMRE